MTKLVDPKGIEPSTLPCHGSMLPVYHGPGLVFSHESLVLCYFIKNHSLLLMLNDQKQMTYVALLYQKMKIIVTD